MPRSASQSPDDALQGNLFGAPEPAAARTIGPVLEFDEWDAVVRNVISADV